MKKKLNISIIRVCPAGLMIVLMLFAGCGSSGSSEEVNSSERFKEDGTEFQQVQDLDKGIGPVEKVGLNEIDSAMADTGRAVFGRRCVACHKIDTVFIGPAISGVTHRRTPEWIMNMILNPDEMVQMNETARNLLIEYGAPMANQNLSYDEARSVLEYFRTLDTK